MPEKVLPKMVISEKIFYYTYSADSKFDKGHNLRKIRFFGIIFIEGKRNYLKISNNGERLNETIFL